MRLNLNVVARYILLSIFVSFILLMPRSALAHERIEIGPYSVVVGWQEEPAIVGERNALLLIVTEGDAPLSGVEATLDVELLYGGRSFRTNLTPSPTPGEYTAEIFPTVRGQYEVRLFGAIGSESVDAIVAPEEIFSASRIQFPEAQPDILELQETFQTETDELQAQLQTLRLLAYAGLGIGILGLVIAVFALRRQK